MPTLPHHLLGVWNPSYDADAMDAHVALLLHHARAFRAGQLDEDDVYVWWGKLRSPYRQAPLPHLTDILALDTALSADDDRELHLYLTDYRSLYVAHLGAVSAEDVREVPDEEAHVPDYYRTTQLPADCWFQLWDIRRLVLDDTPAVIEQLRNLRDVRYHGQRVSLYGGMVDLPLLVTRPDEARWFDDRSREQLTGGRHWVEFDAERAGAGQMQHELRENRFGATLWTRLDPAARAFIATAEHLFRVHRTDAAFDLSAVVVDLAKAVEVQVNALLRAALAPAERSLRFANVDGVANLQVLQRASSPALVQPVVEQRRRGRPLRQAALGLLPRVEGYSVVRFVEVVARWLHDLFGEDLLHLAAVVSPQGGTVQCVRRSITL